ncbi:hypothetical protein AGMMS49531_01660 [Endomicrobiia bacterium]|nr:hypothetical protein AGMMS49531_01660 [Endomicrobiia bacterium]
MFIKDGHNVIRSSACPQQNIWLIDFCTCKLYNVLNFRMDFGCFTRDNILKYLPDKADEIYQKGAQVPVS